MHFTKISIAFGFLFSGALASIGGACHSSLGSGTCQKTSNCGGFYVTGACPNDPTDVKCCIKESCTGISGTCRNTVFACAGSYVSGHCPGDSSIQCCSPATPSSSDIASKAIAAAKTQAGVPYSYGGGGCNGKSRGIDQGKNTIGFDCSGLTQFAFCQATNKKTVIPRTAATQYTGGKRIPLSEARPGDLIFYGNKATKTECSGVHHVVIWLGNNRVWAAQHTGTRVGEFPFSKNNVCPYAVRYW